MSASPEADEPRGPVTNSRGRRSAALLARERRAQQGGDGRPRNKCVDPHCNSTEFERYPELSGLYCVLCGEPQDAQSSINLEADVEWKEDQTGAQVTQGDTIGEDERHARSNVANIGRLGGGMSASEKSDVTAKSILKMLINKIADPNIHEGIENYALKLYQLVRNTGIVKNLEVLLSACLYLAARSHRPCTVLLMDFAVTTRTDVFDIGRTYHEIKHRLWYEEPGFHKDQTGLVVVEELIEKFAMRLEFGEKQQKVIGDAVTLIKRMNRDWMLQGRNPAGICGACILLAARMNNFARSLREVVFVVRVTDVTVMKRIEEFKRTRASQMSVSDFRKKGAYFKDPTAEPPSIYKAREMEEKRKRKLAQMMQENGEESSAETSSDSSSSDEEPETPPKKQRTGQATSKAVAPATRKSTRQQARSDDTPAQTESPEKAKSTKATQARTTKAAQSQTAKVDQSQTAKATQSRTTKAAKSQTAKENKSQTAKNRRDADGFAIPDVPVDPSIIAESASSVADQSTQKDSDAPPAKRRRGRPRKNEPGPPPKKAKQQIEVSDAELMTEMELEAEIFEIMNDPTMIKNTLFHDDNYVNHWVSAEEIAKQEGHLSREAENLPEDGNLTAPEVEEDFDVKHCLNSPNSRKAKEIIWTTNNMAYLREDQERKRRQTEKELRKHQAEEQEEEDEGEDGQPKKRKRKVMGDGSLLAGNPARSASEAAERMLNEQINKAASKFIDGDALLGLYTTMHRRGSNEGQSQSASASGNVTGDEAGRTTRNVADDDELYREPSEELQPDETIPPLDLNNEEEEEEDEEVFDEEDEVEVVDGEDDEEVVDGEDEVEVVEDEDEAEEEVEEEAEEEAEEEIEVPPPPPKTNKRKRTRAEKAIEPEEDEEIEVPAPPVRSNKRMKTRAEKAIEPEEDEEIEVPAPPAKSNKRKRTQAVHEVEADAENEDEDEDEEEEAERKRQKKERKEKKKKEADRKRMASMLGIKYQPEADEEEQALGDLLEDPTMTQGHWSHVHKKTRKKKGDEDDYYYEDGADEPNEDLEYLEDYY